MPAHLIMDQNYAVMTHEQWAAIERNAPVRIPHNAVMYGEVYAPMMGRYIVIQDTIGM